MPLIILKELYLGSGEVDKSSPNNGLQALPTASARASLRLFPAPDALR
jgi:hypothetical protein